MLNIHEVKSVYIACGATDLRKSIDGLSMIVQEYFELDPFQPALFVFCNRSRNRLKILHWDYNGFWLYLKRLERGRFQWPEAQDEPIQINLEELKWLLDGYSIRQGKVFKEVKVSSVV